MAPSHPEVEKLVERLGFGIERRAGIHVLVWSEGGCRPATDEEVELWRTLASLVPQQPGEGGHNYCKCDVSAPKGGRCLKCYGTIAPPAPQPASAVAEVVEALTQIEHSESLWIAKDIAKEALATLRNQTRGGK